jgi:hypothetical protein
VSAIFALAAIGFLAIRTSQVVHQVAGKVAGVPTEGKGSLSTILLELNETIRTANDTINQARDIERDNRKEIRTIDAHTLAVIEHMDQVTQDFDATQKQAGDSIAETSAALVPVIRQAHDDLADLQPTIKQLLPLAQQTTAIAANVNSSTADIQHEIHALVYPPPRKWYQKYFLDPVRIVAKMVTIPVR